MKKNYSEIRKDLKVAIESEMAALDVNYVYGELTKSKHLNDLPLHWLFPIPHTPETSGANSEQHGFGYSFVTLVKDATSVEEGKEKAEELSSKLYDHISRSDAENGILEVCHTIVPGQINPAFKRGENERIFWASFEMNFIVRRYKTTTC